MGATKVIARHAPNDGREWGCQCARCGSSLDFERCENCAGEGVDGHDCGEDYCCCLDPEDNVTCDYCRGEGYWPHCLSSAEWCEAHPMPGREKVPRGKVEWFVVEERRRAR